MNLPIPDGVKKAKGPFIYTLKGDKYYDFRQNSNILGFSHPKLTRPLKNALSGSWNISGIRTVYHKRLKALLAGQFGDDYEIRAAFSPVEFWSRLSGNGGLTARGKRFSLWLDHMQIPTGEDAQVLAVDRTESYLNPGEKEAFESGEDKNILYAANYYHYPHLEIPSEPGCPLIMLPELYSGMFNWCIILIKKELTRLLPLTLPLTQIPALYICSALKLYYLLKKYDIKSSNTLENRFTSGWKDFHFKGRLFTYKSEDPREIEEIARKFREKKILLTTEPPYYNYIPVNLEDYHYKYLTRLKDL